MAARSCKNFCVRLFYSSLGNKVGHRSREGRGEKESEENVWALQPRHPVPLGQIEFSYHFGPRWETVEPVQQQQKRQPSTQPAALGGGPL